MTDQIEVLSRDEVKIRSCFWRRSDIVKAESRESSIVYKLGWREILRMMDEFEEPAPKWEPGTIVKTLLNPQWLYRMDEFSGIEDGMQKWKYTELDTGRESTCHIKHPEHYEIHRLPHEFKKMDWVYDRKKKSTFQVYYINGNNILNGYREASNRFDLIHVPAPEEFGMQAQAAEEMPAQEGQVIPNDDDTTIRPVSTPTSAVTGAHRAVETSEKPFAGPHWDALNNEIAELEVVHRTVGVAMKPRYYDLLRLRELRDELDRLAGREKR